MVARTACICQYKKIILSLKYVLYYNLKGH